MSSSPKMLVVLIPELNQTLLKLKKRRIGKRRERKKSESTSQIPFGAEFTRKRHLGSKGFSRIPTTPQAKPKLKASTKR